MGDDVDPAALARLRARATWSEGAGDATGTDATGTDAGTDAGAARRRAECAASRTGHVAVEMLPDEVPRCGHCGATLSPDALRRAGIKGRRA